MNPHPPLPHTRPEKKDTISLEDFFKINLPIQRSPRAKISPCPDLTFFPTPRPPLLLLPSLLICSCPRGRLCFTHLPFNAEKPQRDNRKGDFYFRLANAHPQGGKKPRGGVFSHVFEEGKSTQELFGSLVACRSLRKPWRTGRKTTFFFFFFFFANNVANSFFHPFLTEYRIKIYLAGAKVLLMLWMRSEQLTERGGKAAALPACWQGFFSPSLTPKSVFGV